VTGGALLLVVLSIFQISQLVVTNDPIRWFAEDHPIRLSSDLLEDKLSGSSAFELVIDTGQPGGVYDPVLLNKVDAWLQQFNATMVEEVQFGQAYSVLTLLKETHQVLHGGEAAYYRIPTTREEIAQSLLLIEMGRAVDLFAFTNDSFSELRVLLQTHAAPTRDKLVAQSAIATAFQEQVGPIDMLQFTGQAQVMAGLLEKISDTMVRGYLIGASLITVIMILLMRSVRLGLIAMIPNLFPVIVVLGFMSLVGMPLDIFTIILGPIALGIAVDDTLHFMHGVRRYYLLHGRTRQAVRESLEQTGEALMVTTLTLFAGFMICNRSRA
jgi:predicted RND superfamily exporter protein